MIKVSTCLEVFILGAVLIGCATPVEIEANATGVKQTPYRTITPTSELPPQILQVDFLLNKGEKARRAGDLNLAIQCFRDILAIDPHDKLALESLAQIHYKQGDKEAAWNYFHELFRGEGNSVSSAESDSDVLVAYGELAYLRGDLAEARFGFEEAIRNSADRIGADYPSIRLQGNDLATIRAQGYMAAGLEVYIQNRLDDAESWTKKALAIRPSWEEARVHLAYFYLHANPNRPREAKIEFEKLKDAQNPQIRKLVNHQLTGFWTSDNLPPGQELPE